MKKKNNKGLLWLGVGALVLSVVLFMIPASGNNKQLDGKSFVEKFAGMNNAVMLDVRTPAEFASGHIDKAVNVDYENQSFESEIKKLDTNKTYFVYCRSGNRSGKSIVIMKSNGFKNIYELKGGISMSPELLTK